MWGGMGNRSVAAARRVLVTLAGCAAAACTAVAPATEVSVAEPLRPASFRLSRLPEQAEASAAEQRVAAALVRQGLHEAAAGEAADYTVEIASGDRPWPVTAAAPAEAGGPATLAARPKRTPRTLFSRAVASLALRIVDTRSGREVYSARATLPHRREGRELTAPLAEAVLRPLSSGSAVR